MMVIRYPTGLYQPIPDDDITWYISSNDPPRASTTFQQVPAVEELRPMPPKIYPDPIRRKSMADLAFTIVEPSRSDVGSAKQQFEVGQILDFTEEALPTLSIPSSPQVEIRHDTNVLDLASIGIDDKTAAVLNVQAANSKKQLDSEYEIARTAVENLKIEIKENQKKINETNKAIAAVTIIGDEKILAELKKKLTSLIAERDQLAAMYEEQVAVSEDLKDKIRQVSQLVR